MKKIDLHIHTNKSDGDLTPEEVVDEAVKNGVEIISIADHDTVAAYSDEFLDYAESKNVNVIKAVEISTRSGKVRVHVLGYDIDIYNEELKQRLSNLRNARHIYLSDVAGKLSELGYIVNVDELGKIDAVTKAHIALDVTGNTQNSELLNKEFGRIPGKGEFIETIMNEGCPAYVKKETLTPVEAAELIRNAGGKVVLAHPVAYRYEGGLDEGDILKILKDMKADGVESNYIYYDRNDERFDESGIWNKLAKDNDLITTIGSDFHNFDGIRPLIGLINENINLTDEDIDKIINNLLKK